MCMASGLVLDPAQWTVSPGGEEIAAVAGRIEDVEYASYKPGAYALEGCAALPDFVKPFHLETMMRHMLLGTEARSMREAQRIKPVEAKGLTIFVMRYEYCNLYHTMTDWFNTFQALVAFNVSAGTPLQVVWVDGHAKGLLDEPWRELYGPVRYLSQITTPTRFERALLVHAGYSSPINQHIGTVTPCSGLPAIRDFARFALSSYGLPHAQPWPRVAADAPLRITLLVRRTYVAHPRNMNGYTTRKLDNCDELAAALRSASAQFDARCYVFTEYSYGEQLHIIARTDVLIGMHGAGLSHALFLPPQGVLLELMPSGYSSRMHYQNFCAWRALVCRLLPDSALNVVGDETWSAKPDAIVSAVQAELPGIRERRAAASA